MTFAQVMSCYGYQRDKTAKTEPKVKLFGRGSTAGPNPVWRNTIVVLPTGHWEHYDGVGTRIGTGRGANDLANRLLYYHAAPAPARKRVASRKVA